METKKPFYKKWWFWVIAIIIYPIGIVFLCLFIPFKIYEHVYYKSEKFLALKNQIAAHVHNCNELNQHIEELKSLDFNTGARQYGQSTYQDTSRWNYRRAHLDKLQRAPHIYDCSLTVANNSRRDPMQYLCKYFGFKTDENTLANVEEVLNAFDAANTGRALLLAEKQQIRAQIDAQIPDILKKFGQERLDRELGFTHIDLSDAHFPVYMFRYVSAGGNASTTNTIVMNLANLNALVTYLNDRIKWRKSVAGQRALMTSALRQQIMQRDNYTCKNCSASTYREPNLLLEIDHIIPLSKGGMTQVENLQTLCWRCNRSKGAKIL